MGQTLALCYSAAILSDQVVVEAARELWEVFCGVAGSASVVQGMSDDKLVSDARLKWSAIGGNAMSKMDLIRVHYTMISLEGQFAERLRHAKECHDQNVANASARVAAWKGDPSRGRRRRQRRSCCWRTL